jgi:hypothetical protein
MCFSWITKFTKQLVLCSKGVKPYTYNPPRPQQQKGQEFEIVDLHTSNYLIG